MTALDHSREPEPLSGPVNTKFPEGGVVPALHCPSISPGPLLLLGLAASSLEDREQPRKLRVKYLQCCVLPCVEPRQASSFGELLNSFAAPVFDAAPRHC